MQSADPTERWAYREHTRVKHILLGKYLWVWITALGKWNPMICYVDGFAGRGRYADGTLGSPLIALRIADRRAEYYGKMLFVFVEKDKDHYRNLEEVLEQQRPSIHNVHKMEIMTENDEFAWVFEDVLREMEKQQAILVPSFFFVDPFGFRGVPFELVEKILSNPRTEVFFTFMVSYIERFITQPTLAETFTTLFGTDQWRDIIPLRKREKGLIELYRRQLHEAAGVKYSFPFRVCETKRFRTLYYLIHVTNNFIGHQRMKQIMFRQSALGSFAYLGPKDVSEQYEGTLFDIDDIWQLKEVLLQRLKGLTLAYEDIEKTMCDPWYSEPPYVDKHYRQALKGLEKDDRIWVHRVTSKTKRGLSGEDRITFPSSNPAQVALPLVQTQGKTAPRTPKVHYREYSLLDGTKKVLVSKVGDGSIITRFDKTPPPQGKRDVVCPHFLELKWAYGCPFDCAWCYLKGTFRFRPEGTSPVVKPYEKTRVHVQTFLSEAASPEILNTGEISDSLMTENSHRPFSKFIIPLFQEQNRHRVLFLTKSSNIRHLLHMGSHSQAIVSFSLNAMPVAERWEKAPQVEQRIQAAKSVFDAGYEVRVRIDPMVPIDSWSEHYFQLLRMIFDNFTPERITLGSLRGLQSTINGCTDKTWVRYLKTSSNWGKKIDFETRLAMYSALIDELASTYNYDSVALCKETVRVWETIGIEYKSIRCNCTA